MNEASLNQSQIEQHSITKSVVLHLFPAVIWLIFYIPLARLASEYGIPSMLVMYIVGILTLLPVELGYLYYQGKKLNGIFSLKGIVLFREKMPWWQYIVFGFIVLAWILIVFLGFGPLIMGFIEAHLFSWIPDWYWLSRGSIEQNAPSVEILLYVLGFILLAISGPIIEELYFRGYLLPRLSRFGKWAPLINVVLFTLYHFWQPHFLVIGIISLLPIVYIVWRKKNIYLSIGLHCFINTLGWVMELIQRLNS